MLSKQSESATALSSQVFYLKMVYYKDHQMERKHFCRWVSHYSLQTELAQSFKHSELGK